MALPMPVQHAWPRYNEAAHAESNCPTVHTCMHGRCTGPACGRMEAVGVGGLGLSGAPADVEAGEGLRRGGAAQEGSESRVSPASAHEEAGRPRRRSGEGVSSPSSHLTSFVITRSFNTCSIGSGFWYSFLSASDCGRHIPRNEGWEFPNGFGWQALFSEAGPWEEALGWTSEAWGVCCWWGWGIASCGN